MNGKEELNNYKRSYYTFCDTECLDMMSKLFGKKEVAIFCKLNAFKYRMRVGKKTTNINSIKEDLDKANYYEQLWKINS